MKFLWKISIFFLNQPYSTAGWRFTVNTFSVPESLFRHTQHTLRESRLNWITVISPDVQLLDMAAVTLSAVQPEYNIDCSRHPNGSVTATTFEGSVQFVLILLHWSTEILCCLFFKGTSVYFEVDLKPDKIGRYFIKKNVFQCASRVSSSFKHVAQSWYNTALVEASSKTCVVKNADINVIQFPVVDHCWPHWCVHMFNDNGSLDSAERVIQLSSYQHCKHMDAMNAPVLVSERWAVEIIRFDPWRFLV